MSHYLIEELRGKSNVAYKFRSEVVAAHGATNLTAIDIRDNANGDVTPHECGGVFVFIGPMQRHIGCRRRWRATNAATS
jgi:thioredoxin reductase (NADPH)